MCPILTGLKNVSYSTHRAKKTCPILTGLNICVLYSHRDDQMCPIFLCSNFPIFSTAYVSHRRLFTIVSYFLDVSSFPNRNRTHTCNSLSSNRTHMLDVFVRVCVG